MKKIGFILAAFVFTNCQQQHKEIKTTPVITTEDSIHLHHFKEVLWPKAYREQDTILLDSLLGNDFQMIDANGNWYSKADEMNYIQENATENDSFWYEIKRFDIYDNGTAIISGTGHITNDTTKTIYQSSNILIKRDGFWKAVTSHVSGIKPVNQKK